MKFIKDILKEKSGREFKYSQGRVYLFIAFLSYIILLGFLALETIKCNFAINIKAPETIIDALQWIIALFAGYVFGGKGLEVLKLIMNKSTNSKSKKSILEKNNKTQ